MNRPTVLNVDDKGANLYIKSRALRAAGFEVIEATTGEVAIDVAFRRHPDLVLLDLKLPDIDGFDVCRILKSDPRTRDIPVVHISAALLDEASRNGSKDAGAEAYLAEPVGPRDLTTAVHAALRLRPEGGAPRVDRAELEAMLERARAAQAQAEEAARAKDEFLAVLSHELRTPMAAMLGWLHLARSGKLPPAEQARALEVIERNARLQLKMVDQLLDAARMATGKLEIEEEPVALDEAVRDAVELARVSAAERRIRISLEIGPGPWTVRGSGVRLRQIFGNLLANAAKFSPEGGEIVVRGWQAGDEARVAVIDQGIGIAPELLPRIFDDFRQAEGAPARRHGGLGLGLAIVRSLVELHGGQVRAESDGAGRGARFTVSLPLLGS